MESILDNQRLPAAGNRAAAVVGFIQLIRRHKMLIGAFAVLLALAGYGLSLLQPTAYEAQAELILDDPRNNLVFERTRQTNAEATRYVRNEAEFIQSTSVAARASEVMGGNPSAAAIHESVVAIGSRDLDLITIRAKQPTPSEAQAVANAVTEAYQQLKREAVTSDAELALSELTDAKTDLESRAAQLEQQLAEDPANTAVRAERDAAIGEIVEMNRRIEEISVNAALYSSGVKHVQPAELPEQPVQPRPLRNAAAAGVLGLLGTYIVLRLREERHPLASHRHDPAAILGAPLLGAIPELKARTRGAAPSAELARADGVNAYEYAATALLFVMEEHDASVVLVTSAFQGDGKTTSAFNLALAAAGDGRAPILVDADMRAQGLTLLLNGSSPEEPGLAELCLGKVSLPENCVREWQASDGVTVSFVTAGGATDDALRVFARGSFDEAIGKIGKLTDTIIIDGPPMVQAPETPYVSQSADGVVVVVRRDTPLEILEEVRDRVALTGRPILGYLFTRELASSRPYGYGGKSGGHYGAYATPRRGPTPAR